MDRPPPPPPSPPSSPSLLTRRAAASDPEGSCGHFLPDPGECLRVPSDPEASDPEAAASYPARKSGASFLSGPEEWGIFSYPQRSTLISWVGLHNFFFAFLAVLISRVGWTCDRGSLQVEASTGFPREFLACLARRNKQEFFSFWMIFPEFRNVFSVQPCFLHLDPRRARDHAMPLEH